jgi:hypothetical protein
LILSYASTPSLPHKTKLNQSLQSLKQSFHNRLCLSRLEELLEKESNTIPCRCKVNRFEGEDWVKQHVIEL